MKKRMRMIISLILAVLLALSVVPTAFADEAKKTTVTVENAAEDHSYSLYQIFKGNYVKQEGGTYSLDNIYWGNGVDENEDQQKALLAAVQKISVAVTQTDEEGNETTSLEAPFANCQDAMQVAGVLLKYKTNSALLAKFSNTVAPYMTNAAATLTVGQTTTDPIDEGYYLVVDSKTQTDPDTQETKTTVYTRSLLQVIGDETNTLTIKTGTPTTQKKVKDTNDSDPENTSDGYTDWQDSADHDIGDEVPFQFTATLPDNYDSFETYKMIFHDQQDGGLTFDKDSVVVKVDGYVVEGGYTVLLKDETGIVHNDCTFEVQIPDLKSVTFETDTEGNPKYTADQITSSSIMTVEYKSVLNSNAVFGSAGNWNQMKLQYSVLNSSSGDGTSDDTEETPWDKVVVFTYRTIIDKVDQSGAKLKGADFTLYKLDTAGNWVPVTLATEDNKDAVAKIVSTDGTNFEFKGLDDGKYMIAETTVPDGFNEIDPIYFSIVATHNDGDTPSFDDLSAKILNKAGEVITNNLSGQVVFTPDNTEGSLSTTVVNTDGSSLPETGGIGTTLFYAIGSIIAISAVILLITKKRMKNQNS